MIKFGSVCSGIESASVAWEPLGMSAAWFAEIEPFPCSVLAHHWPNVPNLGDMTTLPALIRSGKIEAPDILVGGTPCQAYSVAGKREGLADERGQLTLTYVEVLDAIDEQRAKGDECVAVWENVPGVLSSKDNAFGCFLGDLVGEDIALEPAGKKWTNAGCVYGPKRTVAWRVINAQYFGVAQRRRRVFVVASARKGFYPGKVLFESEGVRRDIAPSREAGAQVAALTASGVGTCGADDNQAQAGHIIGVLDTQCGYEKTAFQSVLAGHIVSPVSFQPRIGRNGRGYGGDLVPALCAHSGSTGKGDSAPCVAFAENSRAELRIMDLPGALSAGGGKAGQDYPAALTPDGPRRLMPVECERLQGFPDKHTFVPHKDKPAFDGPRYKAIGNSKAVPCIKFVGARVLAQLRNPPCIDS